LEGVKIKMAMQEIKFRGTTTLENLLKIIPGLREARKHFRKSRNKK